MKLKCVSEPGFVFVLCNELVVFNFPGAADCKEAAPRPQPVLLNYQAYLACDVWP